MQIKVFFTWHCGEKAQLDEGFKKRVSWDIPLTDGYEFEAVPNISTNPGSHHFWGLRNPSLFASVLAWQPDAVHITGYAYHSHLSAMRRFAHLGIPVFFRGDSHLLDSRGSWSKWQMKRLMLSTVYSWPAAFLCVGKANREYYRAFGVPEEKLFDCPHSIETGRFSEPDEALETQARDWKAELKISEGRKVVLFAGKFEDKKRPIPLMRAFLECDLDNVTLILVGDGAFGTEIRELAEQHPDRFRVLPFQNQSRMPAVYRLADLLALPSAYGETWGLAVNEAMACGRPALVSDRVGCHLDVIKPDLNGGVFKADNWHDFQNKLKELIQPDWLERRQVIKTWAKNWSIEKTEETLLGSVNYVLA